MKCYRIHLCFQRLTSRDTATRIRVLIPPYIRILSGLSEIYQGCVRIRPSERFVKSHPCKIIYGGGEYGSVNTDAKFFAL